MRTARVPGMRAALAAAIGIAVSPALGATAGMAGPAVPLAGVAQAGVAQDGDRAAPPGAGPPREARLGWFGPSDPDDPDSGPFWNGATLALEEINAGGGVAGLLLRLVPGWSGSPWAGGAGRMARLVYDDGVVAVIGSIDGAATHLAEQVAAKALVAVLSPGSTDPSVNLAGVPWAYTVLPGDDAQARAVAAHLAADRGRRPIVLVSATDHDARAAASAFRGAFRAAGLGLDAAFECSPDAADAAAIAELAVAGSPGAVVVLASPAASGRLVAALRGAGHDGLVTGGASLGRRRSLDIAAVAATGVIVPLVHDPGTPRWRRFERAYAARFGPAPDFAAGAAYDAVRMAADAVGRAGPDRQRLLDGLRAAAPIGGVTGSIAFDRFGRNGRRVRLAAVDPGGRLRILPETDRPATRSR